MKCSVLLLAIFALLAVSEAQSVFTHNKLPCKWNVDISVKSLLKKYKIKIDMYDLYLRMREENYGDVVVHDRIYRPDAEYSYKPEGANTTTVYMTIFRLEGSYCDHCDNPGDCRNDAIKLEDWKKDPLKESGLSVTFTTVRVVDPYYGTYDMPIGLAYYQMFGSVNFTNSENDVVYEGEKYKVFYNNITQSIEGRNNKDIFAMYVDSNNRIAYVVTDNDRPGVRTEYKFKYSTDVEPKDFIFKEKYVWNCSRPEVMKEPTKFENTKCSSASVARVALLALLASLLCALLF